MSARQAKYLPVVDQDSPVDRPDRLELPVGQNSLVPRSDAILPNQFSISTAQTVDPAITTTEQAVLFFNCWWAIDSTSSRELPLRFTRLPITSNDLLLINDAQEDRRTGNYRTR